MISRARIRQLGRGFSQILPMNEFRRKKVISIETLANSRGNKFLIADINFTFKNRKLVDLLEQRGEALESKDHIEQVAAENKINKIIFEEYEELTTPLSMFVTFETEYGYLTACKMRNVFLDGAEAPSPELNFKKI